MVPTAGLAQTTGSSAYPIEIGTQPFLSFEPFSKAKTKFGKLTFRSGAILTSDAADFGGFSALHMSENGDRLLAVSDTGSWLAANLMRDAEGHVKSFESARMAALYSGYGPRQNAPKYYSDAEGLAIVDQRVFVAFEAIDVVSSYPLDFDTLAMEPEKIRFPADFEKLNTNKGLEALAPSPPQGMFKGALAAISERGLTRRADSFGWMFDPDKDASQDFSFTVARDSDFDVTDALFLENDDLLILERRFTLADGVGMRLRRVKAGEISPGAVLKGDVIFAAGLSHQIDNMEGMSLFRDAAGRRVLAFLSDDNFSLLQRTIYLEFYLDD